MDRLLIVLVLAAGLGVLWVAWQAAKARLRRSIVVDEEMGLDPRPSLIYFSSPDCAPCRLQQAPIVASLQQAMGDRIRIREYDATVHPELVQRYKVLTVPTIAVVAPSGKVVEINYGVTSEARLRQQFEKLGSDPF